MELTDKFSWRRVWMLWRLYLPALRTQLWAFPLVSAVLSMVVVFTILLWPEVSVESFTMTLGISIMYYFAPVALARRDYHVISDQLPVRTSEKITFLAIYFLIVTMLLTAGVQTLVYGLSSLAFPEFCHQIRDLYGMALAIYPNKTILFISNLTALSMPSMTLMGVVLAKRNRTLMGIISCLGAYLVFCTIGGIVGGIIAVADMTAVAMDPNIVQNIGAQSDHLMSVTENIVKIVYLLVSILSLAAIAVSWTLIYKKMKRSGF